MKLGEDTAKLIARDIAEYLNTELNVFISEQVANLTIKVNDALEGKCFATTEEVSELEGRIRELADDVETTQDDIKTVELRLDNAEVSLDI